MYSVISKLATAYLPAFILMTEVEGARFVIQKYPTDTWARTAESLIKLQRQRLNMVKHKKLEIIAGAIDRDTGTTKEQNVFSQVFNEFFKDQKKYLKSDTQRHLILLRY